MNALFNYFIFPGFLFSACVGLMACWLDRKVTARLQWRKGPPWHQNFTDIIKLLGKETIFPANARSTFLTAPYLGLLGAALAATMVGQGVFFAEGGFTADLIVIFYLMSIPAIALIIGASSSGNPLASVGASREIKLLLGYELPFILSIATVIIKSEGSTRMSEIITRQAAFGSNIFSFSGAIAFVVALLCVQAKLGYAPFDMAEADQELMGGTLIEYSGAPLAAFKLTRAVLLAAAPLLLIALFLGHNTGPFFIFAKFVMIMVFAILFKNTNPRVRIDQALRFFWGRLAVLALIGLGLAVMGK